MKCHIMVVHIIVWELSCKGILCPFPVCKYEECDSQKYPYMCIEQISYCAGRCLADPEAWYKNECPDCAACCDVSTCEGMIFYLKSMFSWNCNDPCNHDKIMNCEKNWSFFGSMQTFFFQS